MGAALDRRPETGQRMRISQQVKVGCAAGLVCSNMSVAGAARGVAQDSGEKVSTQGVQSC